MNERNKERYQEILRRVKRDNPDLSNNKERYKLFLKEIRAEKRAKDANERREAGFKKAKQQLSEELEKAKKEKGSPLNESEGYFQVVRYLERELASLAKRKEPIEKKTKENKKLRKLRGMERYLRERLSDAKLNYSWWSNNKGGGGGSYFGPQGSVH